MDAPALYGPLTAALLQKAVAEGMGGEDFTLLYRRIEELLKQPSAVARMERSAIRERRRG